MIRRPPRSTLDRSSAASDVYKRQFLQLPLSHLPLHKGTITALLQSIGTMLSINILLHNFQIQSITISPPFLIILPVISSIPTDLPFFNFLALHITSSLLMTLSPKYLFLLAPSNPHTFTITSSLLPMLCRFSKCFHHTLVTFISSVTKAPFLFIMLCKFSLFVIYI